MAKAVALPAERRVRLGSTECRRLRRQGLVPGNLYGHQETPVPLRFKSEDLRPILEQGAHVVEVQVDGGAETALVRDLQWDTFSTHIQHIDLLRVSKDEKVVVDVPIEIRGTPVGVLDEGGILDQSQHSLTIECSPMDMPNSIEVRVSHLKLHDALHVSDLEVGEGVAVQTPADVLVVQVTEPQVIEPEEEEAAEPGAAEPELVGESDGDDSEDEEDSGE